MTAFSAGTTLLAELDGGVEAGHHLGAQVHVRHGEVTDDVVVGEVHPDVPMTADVVMPWYCCSKPVLAVALGVLQDRGVIDVDERASNWFPAFAVAGKADITLRHLLTHTSGIADDVCFGVANWDRALERACAAVAAHPPGTAAAYLRSTSWFVLAEVLQRATGVPYPALVDDLVFNPLGLRDSWLALPPERAAAYGDRLGATYDSSGPRSAVGGRRPTTALTALCNPGRSGLGPMRELARILAVLIDGGRPRLLAPGTAEAIRTPQRPRMFDPLYGGEYRWGLGIMTEPEFFGPHCSPQTVGHDGYLVTGVLVDPAHDLVVAAAFNGRDARRAGWGRLRAVYRAVYSDLGLEGAPTPPTGGPR